MKHKTLIIALILLIIIYFPLKLVIENENALILISVGAALIISYLINYFRRK